MMNDSIAMLRGIGQKMQEILGRSEEEEGK
jgi:hypothetical protein